ncbi:MULTISPECIES: FmdB family zinc ribbon protein [Nocardiaceae]|jgi:putative FmdB family regulatory protein|uniref:FmdB family zinc ribbon protein n=1 Tax=Nocardiaceae TaxID=85025 RepID=UPI000380676F|nr:MULTISPECIES: FmdB family zinc ribbon protein [Rhodococcus]OZC88436.1 FmdB family transcriptional regulator [Rhodococcus sp. 06-418-1B]OZE86351.1 FmdB family transcriptional regulator [Rhodococcus sp. 15-649-1-2]OZF05640.1 FmdB family transcriptional regulator [Rhodococcus sp. 15-1189-1-1a]OZF20423.1 FmdB family transcriptional regulator [Rhodococcus sp. 14-2686-1-2]OZF56505.1 FmdB family transcriptional regulator [Rhodococcus sp. 14-2470-1b]
MPTYSYACTECDNRFDIVQSFSDDSLTVCPACSGKLRKLFNSVGIVFKGSGFYRTDSRGGSSSVSESAGESKSDSSTKTETKTSSTSDSSSSSSSTSTSSTPSKAAASS